MPLRDFHCKQCGREFEAFVKRDPVSHSEGGMSCPACSSADVVAQISAPGGYKMSSGGSSTRPRHAGSFKKGKK